jgi:hypothetical protein
VRVLKTTVLRFVGKTQYEAQCGIEDQASLPDIYLDALLKSDSTITGLSRIGTVFVSYCDRRSSQIM